jgi:hypothetical protein
LHLLRRDLHYNARMWMGPLLYIGVSIFLWKYVGAVFVPELMARSVFALMPALLDLESVVLINVSLIYFAVYFVFAMFWPRLKPHFQNPFVAGLALWLVNVLVLFPLLGRGLLGYRLPQGWISASFPLLVSHWMFARGLQFQQRRS